MLIPTLLGASSNPPAGGAATSDVIYSTAGAVVATILLLGPILLYKQGRFPALGRLAALDERLTKLPGWAALPGSFLSLVLLVAVFGMYWDISLHIDQGRDPGPLANPAHYFILAGLFGVFTAGVLGIALPKGPTGTSYKIAPGWYAPVGALMIAICGASSLAAFPLDDIWHRIFGQDVTLWGPTHLMLIGGAALSVLGAWRCTPRATRSGGQRGGRFLSGPASARSSSPAPSWWRSPPSRPSSTSACRSSRSNCSRR
jgi:hypothetical protein